jgi:hypothetical protein
VVADFCPLPIFSDLDLLNSRGPLLREKYIVDVVVTILVVIEVMCRLLFFLSRKGLGAAAAGPTPKTQKVPGVAPQRRSPTTNAFSARAERFASELPDLRFHSGRNSAHINCV